MRNGRIIGGINGDKCGGGIATTCCIKACYGKVTRSAHRNGGIGASRVPLVALCSVSHQRGGITLTHSRVAADGDVRQRVYGNVGGGRGGTALRIGGRNRVGAGFRYGDTVALSHRAPLVRSAARGYQRRCFVLTNGGVANDGGRGQ